MDRIEAAADNQLRLRAEGSAGPYLLKAVPISFDIRIDRSTALVIPDDPDISHLVLALQGGTGFDARGWPSGIRTRGPTEAALTREKLNAAMSEALRHTP